MGHTRTWLPSLPPEFLARFYAHHADQGGRILGSTTGSILNPVGTGYIAEEQRQARFAMYWSWWSSPEYQERLADRRQGGYV
jgi:hypothetical protein